MTAAMATEKRLRLSFDAKSEVLRRAVYIAAAMQGKSHNDVLNEIIEVHLAKYISLAERALAEEEPRPRRKRDE
jgi:hypothetical protein